MLALGVLLPWAVLDAQALAASSSLAGQDHLWIITEQLVGFHQNELDELLINPANAVTFQSKRFFRGSESQMP